MRTTTLSHSPLQLASDEDLLAMILASQSFRQTRKKAARLLSDVGGLAGLARLGDASQQFEGFSVRSTQRIMAAVEIGLRCAQPSPIDSSVVVSAQDVVTLLGPRFRHLIHEQMWMIGLDVRNRVISRCRISEGGQHGCALLVRDVLRFAVRFGAHSFVLAHNHPGGDPRPSAEDVHLTEQLSSASLCVGIPLIDHVIVASSGHVSLLELGLMPDLVGGSAPHAIAKSRSGGGRSR